MALQSKWAWISASATDVSKSRSWFLPTRHLQKCGVSAFFQPPGRQTRPEMARKVFRLHYKRTAVFVGRLDDIDCVSGFGQLRRWSKFPKVFANRQYDKRDLSLHMLKLSLKKRNRGAFLLSEVLFCFLLRIASFFSYRLWNEKQTKSFLELQAHLRFFLNPCLHFPCSFRGLNECLFFAGKERSALVFLVGPLFCVADGEGPPPGYWDRRYRRVWELIDGLPRNSGFSTGAGFSLAPINENPGEDNSPYPMPHFVFSPMGEFIEPKRDFCPTLSRRPGQTERI